MSHLCDRGLYRQRIGSLPRLLFLFLTRTVFLPCRFCFCHYFCDRHRCLRMCTFSSTGYATLFPRRQRRKSPMVRCNLCHVLPCAHSLTHSHTRCFARTTIYHFHSHVGLTFASFAAFPNSQRRFLPWLTVRHPSRCRHT